MLSKEKFDEMQSVIADCKTLNGMAFSGNHYKVSQFQKAPALLGDALDEILSLREQLAELKKQEPIGQVIFGSYGSDGIREASIVCLHDQADWDNFQDGTLLYLEAKPAED
ncbi:TPA: hypothetical protein ACPZUG_004305 [Yersinia enterocolitica]